MKETLRGFLRKPEEQAEKLLIHQPVKRTTELKETEQSGLKSGSGIPQTKASHSGAPQTKKKRPIPFVALALVLMFASLCVLSLVGPSSLVSVALASVSSSTLHKRASLPLDKATSPANCVETNCYGQFSTSDGFTGPLVDVNEQSCQGFQNASLMIGTQICADPNDFLWANLDITCVYNDPNNLNTQLTNFNSDTGYTSNGQSKFGPPWVNPNNPNQNLTPVAEQTHIPPSESFYNQNTCVPGHQCRSNNGSGLDAYNPNGSNPALADDDFAVKTGGDDVVCKNDACIANGQATGDTGLGNVCGSGIAYDKLACYWISGNWYYNPTAYAPDGALEQGITGGSINVSIVESLPDKLHDSATAENYGIQTNDGASSLEGSTTAAGPTLRTSNSDPVCQTPPAGGGVGHWTCDSGSRIVLVMTAGATADESSYVFQGSPMTIKPTMGSNGVSVSTGTTWTYPPTWEVMCVGTGQGGEFPCSDINGTPNVDVIKTDWLSGDPGINSSAGAASGHIAITYNADTVGSPNLQKIFGITMGVGYLLIAPTMILIGYQLIWASWTLGRASAMDAFGRMLLSILAVGVSFALCQMLIGLFNLVTTGLMAWHAQMQYPEALISGKYYQYTLAGDNDPASFRGVVVPVSRWGCLANEFVGILSSKLAGDISSNVVPYFGGFIGLATGIADAVDFARRIGEFAMLILSINLFAQVVMRIILVNYYIVTSPIMFACWGLPGGTGQKVVGQWFKGFVSLLAIQAIQVFVLTTLPFLIPAMPALPTDSTFGLITTFLGQLPPLIVLICVVRIPTLLGTGSSKVIAQAGTTTAGAVTALGGAAYKTV